MQDLIFKLKIKLKEAFERNRAQSLLFSGGLDTGILACLDPRVKAITISLESFGDDLRYAESLARRLKMEHIKISIKTEEAIESIPEVVKILKSFDPAIPNDITVYFGLKAAREIGVKEIMTGDGADELFAGYDFMKGMEDLDGYIKRLASSMCFNSNRLGDFMGISIRQPYLDREFVSMALDIPKEFKIRKKGESVPGKWILRKAFENDLSHDIAWQEKRPLEYGSGMTRLREIISSKISSEEFREKKKLYPVRFINKEHLYFYEIYRRVVGEIPPPENGQKSCAGCGAGMGKQAFHCRICGGVLK